MDSNRVALYGLGNMGFPIAERLARCFPLHVADLDADVVEKACQTLGCVALERPEDLARIRTVVLCLPTPAASEAVLKQIASHLPPDAIVIETGTVNAQDVEHSLRLLQPYGVRIMDASILAGVSQMEAGTATLLLGGEADTVAACQVVLDAIAHKQIHFGPVGAGAAAKVINNAVAHAVMVVVTEAGSMATASGIDCQKLIGLLSDTQMGLHRPLTYRYAERVVHGAYTGGMPLDAARKDSMLALEMAQVFGVPLFAIQGAHTVYDIASAAGYGREDYAVIAKLWSDWGRPAAPAIE